MYLESSEKHAKLSKISFLRLPQIEPNSPSISKMSRQESSKNFLPKVIKNETNEETQIRKLFGIEKF